MQLHLRFQKHFLSQSNILIVLFFLFILPTVSFAQKDSTKKSMSFDFGLTRDRNINLWPVFKRTISQYEKDKQLLFPIYRSYQNFKFGEKRSHILPVFWKDSSENSENLRIISTYYPSLIHISKDGEEKTKTFTFLELAPRVNLLEFKKSPDGLVMQNNLLLFLWFKNNKITQKSYLIVFPTYWQFKNPERESTTLFPLFSYGSYLKKKNNYSAITPLFWHFDSPIKSSNLLFPVWWNRKTVSAKDTSTSNLVFPIYWSHKDQSKSSKILFPTVWSINNPRYKSFSIAPIVSWGQSTDLERHHLVVTPLFLHFKNEEGENTTLFPLVWKSSWNTRFEHYSSLVIFPIYWEQKNNDNHSQVLLPFVWSKSTPTYRTITVIPLLSVGQSPDNSIGHTIVTPLFWHYRSPELNSNTLFPIWWNRTRTIGNATKKTNIVFPLYWETKDPSSKRNIFFPLVWNFNNSEYHTFTFIPFTSFGKSADGKSAYKAITPFYWDFKTEQGSGKFLFPLWWQNDRNVNGEFQSSSRVVLLYWKYYDKVRKHQGVLPLVWSLQNATNRSFTFFPLFSMGVSKDSSTNYLAVTPLYWHFKNRERAFSTLFPIWWDRKDIKGGNPKHFNLLLPLYFAKWDSIDSKKVLFPIIWSLKNTYYQSFTFVPLFSYGKSFGEEIHHLAITPLFWHFRNPEGYSATLIPLFWKSKYGDGDAAVRWNVIFPLYWSNRDINRNNKVLFPIIWSFNNPRYRTFTFAPLFSVGHSSDNTRRHTVITPLIWNLKSTNSHSRVFFPIWWNVEKTVNKKTVKTNVIFPLYLAFSNQYKTTRIGFPLIWNFRSPKTHSFTFVPLFSKGQRINGGTHLMVTPLFWKFDSKAKHYKMLFPLFTSYNDTASNKQFDILFVLLRHNSNPKARSTSILWPIIERSVNDQSLYFRFAPLIWSKKSPTNSYFTFQPFFYHSISKEQEIHRILWELYVRRNQFEIKKSNSILWKVATWDRYKNGDKETRVLHLLYSNSNVGGNIEKSLFPFYYLTKEQNGNRSLSIFLYFYNSLKRQVPNTKEYYQEERIFWLIRIRSNYQVLKAKGIKVE